MDEDGERLMDPDDVPSDREPSPYAGNQFDDGDEWHRERSPRERSPTPTFVEDKVGKPRKRLVKKSASESSPEPGGSSHLSAFGGEDLDDWGEEEPVMKKKMKKPDSDGERLMDPGDVPSDREPSPYAGNQFDDGDEWHRERSPRERSPTPTFVEDKVGKPRKRLVKKSARESSPEPGGSSHLSAFGGEDLDDWGEEEPVMKKKMKKPDSDKEWKRKALSKPGRSSGKGSASGSKGYDVDSSDHGGDPEMKELWDTIAGDDSEEDVEDARTIDDDTFIDDTGSDPSDRFGSDNEAGFVRDASQDEYIRLKEQHSQSSLRDRYFAASSQVPSDLSLWIQVAGGKNRGRTYGLGLQDSAFDARASHASLSYYSGMHMHDFHRAHHDMVGRIGQLETQQQQYQHQLAEQQAKYHQEIMAQQKKMMDMMERQIGQQPQQQEDDADSTDDD